MEWRSLSGIGGWPPRCRSPSRPRGRPRLRRRAHAGRAARALRRRSRAGRRGAARARARPARWPTTRRSRRGRRPQQAAPVRGRQPRRGGLPQHARGAGLRGAAPGRGRPRARARRALPALPHRHGHDRLHVLGPVRSRARLVHAYADTQEEWMDSADGTIGRRLLAIASPLAAGAGRDDGVGGDRHRARGGRGGRPGRAGDRGRGPARPPPRALLADRGVGGGPARAGRHRRVPVQRQRLRRAAAAASE